MFRYAREKVTRLWTLDRYQIDGPKEAFDAQQDLRRRRGAAVGCAIGTLTMLADIGIATDAGEVGSVIGYTTVAAALIGIGAGSFRAASQSADVLDALPPARLEVNEKRP